MAYDFSAVDVVSGVTAAWLRQYDSIAEALAALGIDADDDLVPDYADAYNKLADLIGEEYYVGEADA